MRTCPHCGSGIPELSKFSPIQREIIETVRKAPGLSLEQITQRVYASDPNGGPTSNCVSVHLRSINRKLEREGYRIGGTPGNRHAGIGIHKL